MELTANIQITDDRQKIVITDTTDWEGQRNDFVLYCQVQYNPYDKDPVQIDLTTDNTSTTEESIFEAPYLKDGWYTVTLTAVPIASHPFPVESLPDEFDFTLINEIFLVNLIVQRNCQLEKYFECLQCTSCKCEQIKEDLVKLESLIQATDYRFHSGKEFEAQKMTEQLTKQFKCCK